MYQLSNFRILIIDTYYLKHTMSRCSDVIYNKDLVNLIFDFHGKNSYISSSILSKTHLDILAHRGKNTSVHHFKESPNMMYDLTKWDMISTRMVEKIFSSCAKRDRAQDLEIISSWYRESGMKILDTYYPEDTGLYKLKQFFRYWDIGIWVY